MLRPEPLYQWADRVATRFPALSSCQDRMLEIGGLAEASIRPETVPACVAPRGPRCRPGCCQRCRW